MKDDTMKDDVLFWNMKTQGFTLLKSKTKPSLYPSAPGDVLTLTYL